LAKKEVFIQSPVFNASPIVEAVLEACKRGITVILYIGLGFNDFAEGIVPFQGGTNDTVRARMQTELTSCNKQQYLKWHWYVAKDQTAPLRFEKQSRNNHVKFLQVDGQVAVQGLPPRLSFPYLSRLYSLSLLPFSRPLHPCT
jgi:phosphatidylserine/phosphatidylglycerophosphate/cardiolipin synthase-like enzyme